MDESSGDEHFALHHNVASHAFGKTSVLRKKKIPLPQLVNTISFMFVLLILLSSFFSSPLSVRQIVASPNVD